MKILSKILLIIWFFITILNVQSQTLTVNTTASTICVGESVNLNVSGSNHYKWSPVTFLNTIYGSNIIATPLVTTNYTVTDTSKWINISAGGKHTLGLKSNGSLWSWGNNDYGQLGYGNLNASNYPNLVGNDTNWISLSAGWQNSLGLKSNGTILGWGNNGNGQLGIGNTTNNNTAAIIGTSNNWSNIVTGSGYSCGIKSNGTIWGWGDNSDGQLGDGTRIQRTSPIQIGIDTNWKLITIGDFYTLGLRTNGTLWAWGRNSSGQLGDGTNISRLIPNIIGNSTWIIVDAGDAHTIGIKSNKTLWAWGNNLSGQIGNGTFGNIYNTAILISSDTNWSKVSAGGNHSLAIKNNGTLWSWGSNDAGQLGDGTTVNKITPIQIGTDTTWVSISAGYRHSIALKSDGTMWAWGDNNARQLGNGNISQSNSPIQVSIFGTITIEVNPKPISGFKINNVTQCLNGNNFLFTDTTSIKSGTFTRLWNFGDASTAASSPFTKTYSNANMYQVKLVTTSNFGCKDSITKTVTVNPKPSVGFTTNVANQCLNTNSYSFADTSKISSGTLNRFWTLGNGDTTSITNPNKVYSNPGTYNIRLLSTSDNGCKDSLTKTVIVYPNTKIGFKINNPIQCLNGNSFLYTDTSSISSGTITLLWNFGDSSTATTSPFTKTYSNANAYQVKLVTTSNFGCKDSITKTVTVNPKPSVGFTTNVANQCLNINSFSFADTSKISSGSINRLWTLGNVDTTSIINPIKVFSNAGTYSIKLLATSDNACKDSLTKTVIVYPNTKIGFKINNATQCLNGNSFLYTDTSSTSSGNFTRLWNFGDASTATLSSFTKTYSNHNTYQVKLVSTTNNGCKDSITKSVTVYPKPDVYFMNLNPIQCLKGNLFSFTDSSFIGSGSLSRKWYLGDGSIDTNLVANKSYSQAKTYQVKLVVTSNNACKDSMIRDVAVNPQPLSVATAQGRTIVCPGENVNIKASTTNGNTYQWLKNDVPLMSSTDSILQVATQGTYKVITSTTFACADTSQGVSIEVKPSPKANIGINNIAQCLSGNQFEYTDSSTLAIGSLRRLWYLNNVLSDTDFSISKSYNAAGNYTIKLLAISETNCKDSITRTITVHPQPTPDFTINNPSQCLVPNIFVFTDISSISSGSTTRTWYIGNSNNDTTAVATQVYNNLGNSTVKLISKSDKACIDSISKIITVNANPVAGVMLGQTSNVAPTTPYIYTVAQQLNHTYLWSVTNGIVVAGQGTNAVTVQWLGVGAGKIQAVILNPQGCNDTTSLTLSVTNVGIKELQGLSQLELYPNPNNGDFKLKVSSTKESDTRISLLNMLGQEVWTDNKTLSAGAQEIDLTTNVAAGVYILRLNNEYGKVQKSMVVR